MSQPLTLEQDEKQAVALVVAHLLAMTTEQRLAVLETCHDHFCQRCLCDYQPGRSFCNCWNDD